MKKLLLSLFIINYSLSIAFAQPSFIKDSLDKYIEREMKRWNVPGAAVAVVKDGKVVVMRGYGVKEVKSPTPTLPIREGVAGGKVLPDGQAELASEAHLGGAVNENTLFQIASNSKAFTATSLALLDYQKRISLDDKVTKWMPDYKLYDELATKEVTIKDLLCHRIGFQTFQSDLLNWNCNLSRKELITNMRNVKPVYGFRSQYGYCNSGFLTAGEIIPAVTDTSWDDFLKYHFFIPMKMNRSSTTYKTIIADNNACKPYTLVDDKLVFLPYANVDNLGPAASINSCVRDLANWLMMQLDSGRFEGKRIFPYEVLQTTTTSTMIVRDMPASSGATFQTYGLGWFLLDYHGKKVVRHDGGADGFVTTTCFVPQLNLGITVLTNTDANSFYAALRTQIIDAYMNLPYQNNSEKFYKAFSENSKTENAEINKLMEVAFKKPMSALSLPEYTGTYSNEVYGKITITQESAPSHKKNLNIWYPWLTVYFSHHPFLSGKLEPIGGNDFLCTYSIATYGIKKINFNVKDGKVKSVIIRVNDFVDMMEYEFTRVDG